MAQSNLDVSNAALYKIGATKITTLADNSKEAKICTDRVEPVKRALLRMHPWNFAEKRSSLNPVWINIGGAANNGSGLIRVTTSAAHGFSTGDGVTIEAVQGVSANGSWIVTVIDATNFDLQDSVFSGTYIASTSDRCTLAAPFDFQYSIALPSDLLRVLRVNDSQSSPDWRCEGNRLLANEYPLELKYIYDVTDYTKMDVLFYECLAVYLAYDICMHLAQSATIKRDLKTELYGGDGQIGMLPKARFADATEDPAEVLDASSWVESRLATGALRDTKSV